jgi:sensor histidine kinase YesM
MFSVLHAAIWIESGIQLTTLLNKWYPWDGKIKKRFALQLILQLVIVYIVVILFFKLQFPDYYGYDALLLRQSLTIGVISSLMITAVFAAEYFLYKWNDASLKTLEMEQLTTQAQLDALKLQLDPHFLFNNLSIVTALIEDEPLTAISYVAKLSSIYRYMLANRMQNVILLDQELEFIRAYLYLYKIRYGDGINVRIDENEKTTHFCIPPLTLQLLIENAIKHNVFSTDSPLKIYISFPAENSMVIENNKMAKTIHEPSMNMGLKNISERYRLLNQPEPVITSSIDFFRVQVPLIAFNN